MNNFTFPARPLVRNWEINSQLRSHLDHLKDESLASEAPGSCRYSSSLASASEIILAIRIF